MTESNVSTSKLSLICALLVGLAQGAAATALLTVTAGPDPAEPNQQVTITATRGGGPNCGWKVLYGDGNASPAMGFPNSTKSVTTSYANEGSYTIQITGANHGDKPQCTGSQTTTLTVDVEDTDDGPKIEIGPATKFPIKPKLTIQELCKKVDCKGLIQKPVIENNFGFKKPGGVVGWIGKGFGSQQGSVTLRYKNWSGSYQETPLEILEWTPTMVGTRIPASLQGFVQHNASVRIGTSAMGSSAAYSFPLQPALEWRELDEDDVKTVHCGFDGNADRCNDVHQGNDAVFGYFSYTSQGAAIEGFHGNAWGTIGDDKGHDVYEIKVKNGWTIDSSSMWKKLSSGDEWVSGPSPSTPVGSDYWKPSYNWNVSPNDTVQYATFVWIVGPRGVPHK